MIIFLVSGPTSLCANQGIADFSSHANMEEHGWDLKEVDKNNRLMLSQHACNNHLEFLKNNKWIVEQWSTSVISTSFWGTGKATLQYGNCFNEGEVAIFLDDNEIAKSKRGEYISKVTFNVEEGSTLAIKTDDKAIIRLFRLDLECGKHMIFLRKSNGF